MRSTAPTEYIPDEVEEREYRGPYPNYEHRTHKGSRVKNKYRNMTCPCGSGKKFKKCCIGKVD